MRKDIEKMIKTELMALTRPGWSYHPPVYDEQGKFRLGFPDYEAYTRVNKRFYDAGVRIFLSNLAAGWVDEDTYDFNTMDETLDKIFAATPDAYYIPRLRLDTPFAWMEKHPDEVCVFSDGPRDPDEVRELVKQGRVNTTYDMTKPPQPNGLQPVRLDDPIGLQSFSSKLWVRDACKALAAAINHLLSGPYAQRIIGFHICFGGTCELLHWGNGGAKLGDFSIKHTHDFFNWAEEKYGSLANLRQAWGTPELTLETAFVPMPCDRSFANDGPQAVYRQMGKAAMYRDYELFHSQSVIDAFLQLAKTTKELAPDLAVGVFYGYEQYGHEHLDQLLASPNVDYVSAPKPYFSPQPGGYGGSVPKVASIMSQKMFIEEVDNRPHTAWDPRKHAAHINVTPAADFEESANVLWRETCKLEQVNAGWWWMEQGDAQHLWYDDDGLMELVAQQAAVHKALREAPAEDICQVLLISDTAANYYGGIGVPLRKQLLYTGIPFHEYRMSDIHRLDLSKYKVLIFSQPMLMTKEQLESIKSKASPDCQLVFADLPGVCSDGFSLERVAELTGISVAYNESVPAPHCIFNPVSGADEVVCTDEKGPRIARRGNLWLMLDSEIDAERLLELMKIWGAETPVDGCAVVHGNSKLLGVFSTADKGLKCKVTLPQKTDWVEWFTQTEYSDADEVDIDIAPRKARVFIAKSLLK